jgi:hypothetical protein
MGKLITNCRTGTHGITFSTRFAAVSTIARVLHEGQIPLPLQESPCRQWRLQVPHLRVNVTGTRLAIPYISKVDVGTMEVIRSFDVEVVSSADLLQEYTSVWDPQKLESHLAAATVLCKTVDKAWRWISKSL